MVEESDKHAAADNLFSGDALDTVALAAQGARLDRLTASIEDVPAVVEDKNDETDAGLFSGDMHALDPAALAAQAAELAALVEDMDLNLETTELDMTQENQEWSVAAKISSSHEEEESHAVGAMKLDEITQKINDIAVKTLQEEEEELLQELKESQEENQKILEETQPGKSDDKAPKVEFDVEEMEESEESEEEAEVAVNDDLSIDDSESEKEEEDDDGDGSMESDASSVSTLKSKGEGKDTDSDSDHDQDEPDEALHISFKSLSLAEIQVELEEEELDRAEVYSDELLLKNGIVRIDPTSDQQAFICDWERWRQWKEEKQKEQQNSQQNNRSSQRWADNSLQDSSLKMPTRRYSDDDLSSPETSFTSSQNDDISYFDWKAWKRKKGSSTSRTNSFSISSDDDDDFDANSVLDKLNEWEEMEESNKEEDDDDSSSNKNNDSDNSKSSNDDNSRPNQSGTQKLNRANSAVFSSRRRASLQVPVRALSDHSIRVEDDDTINEGGANSQQQWKDWQREKRKSRMQGSWSNINLSMADSHPSDGDEIDSHHDSHHSFENDGSWGDGSQPREEDEATAPTRTQSERLTPNNARPRLKMRSNSLHMFRPPSRRSLHMSPMRSPMQKSPIMGDEWKSWQREKRRTGMLKKTLSANTGWGLPFNDDSGDTSKSNDDAGTGTKKEARKKFTKSQSERWDKKQARSNSAGGDRRQHLKKAHSHNDIPKDSDGENGVFDWKAFRKDKRRNELKRSQSDRWASNPSTEATKDKDKPPSQLNGLRRAQSEKWDARGDSNPEPPSRRTRDVFDWKAYRKDRRKTMKKSNSDRFNIGGTS